MAAVITQPDVARENPVPNQNVFLERLGNEPAPQEQPSGASLLASIARGTILLSFAAGALILLAFGLMPAVLVALLLFLPALAPVILLGLAIVFTGDMQRGVPADTNGQPCSCHEDRLERTFAKR